MARKFACLIAIAVMLLAVCAIASESDKEAAALSAAYGWLKQVDEGNYAGSWQEAAEYFRNTVAKVKWVDGLKAARMPLGKLVSRTVKNTTYATSLPGAPDGKYVVIQFSTSFDNKKQAIETVTPMLDKDGVWRVSGYYIK